MFSKDTDGGVVILVEETLGVIGLEVIDEITGVTVFGHLVAVVFVKGVPMTAGGRATRAEVTVFVDVNGVKGLGFSEAF